MTLRNRCDIRWLASLAVAALLASPAQAQFDSGTRFSNVAGLTALENASGAGGRSPGNLVNSGVARTQTSVITPRLGFSITETTRPLLPRQVFAIDALQAVFDQLNQAILLFQNVLLARAGQPPVIPTSSLPTSLGGATIGGTTTGGTTGGATTGGGAIGADTSGATPGGTTGADTSGATPGDTTGVVETGNVSDGSSQTESPDSATGTDASSPRSPTTNPAEPGSARVKRFGSGRSKH